MEAVLDYVGKIVGKKDIRNCLTLTLQNKKQQTEIFKSFDMQRIDGLSYNLGDSVKIKYKKIFTERGGKFNKVVTIDSLSNSPQIMFLKGTITNTDNSRERSDDNDICFCFKSKYGRKVDYCVANKIIKESFWFKKDTPVQIECIYEERKLNSDKWFKKPHRTLRVINIWRDNE